MAVTKTFIPIKDLHFDGQGKLHLPGGVIIWLDLEPVLTQREWLVYLWNVADKSKMTKWVYADTKAKYCGVRATEWRIKKSLKEKGYLC